MATKFYPVADKSEFSDNDQLHVSLNDEEILLCREEEDYFAISYYCSHATLSLEGGYIYKSKIICPYHGAEFCLKTGNALTPPAYEEIKNYPLSIEGTTISIAVETLVRKIGCKFAIIDSIKAVFLSNPFLSL